MYVLCVTLAAKEYVLKQLEELVVCLWPFHKVVLIVQGRYNVRWYHTISFSSLAMDIHFIPFYLPRINCFVVNYYCTNYNEVFLDNYVTLCGDLFLTSLGVEAQFFRWFHHLCDIWTLQQYMENSMVESHPCNNTLFTCKRVLPKGIL